MAETKNQEEPTLHAKRKPDLNSEEGEEYQKKAQKVEILDSTSSAPVENNEEGEATLKLNSNLEVPTCKCSSIIEEGIEKVESDVVPKQGDNEDCEVDNTGDDDEEDDYEDEDEDEDGEDSNEKDEVDRKEKGIIGDDKGKGKLIEEDDDSDDDDASSDDRGVSDGDGDLSDDPLADVDLNNILPSRTRRRIIRPGVYIANDIGNDEEDDDSYCSDA